MTSAARPGGECWREAAEADPRGFPGVSSVSGDQRREDIRGYQDPDSDQSRHQHLTLTITQAAGK